MIGRKTSTAKATPSATKAATKKATGKKSAAKKSAKKTALKHPPANRKPIGKSAPAIPSGHGVAKLEVKPERIESILKILRDTYPDAECALVHASPWQLLVATILSA